MTFRRGIVKIAAFCAAGVASACGSHDFDVETAERSVVRVLTESGSGSGFVVAPEIVVTNNHVTDGATDISVMRPGRIDGELPATLVDASIEWDLAILKVPGLNAPSIALNDAETKRGADVFAVGFPGFGDTFGPAASPHSTPGMFSHLITASWEPGASPVGIIHHSAAINNGNSGGPLLDNCGRVIGVNTAGPVTQLWVDNGGNVRVNTPAGIFYASHIGSTISLLEGLNVPFTMDRRRCVSSIDGNVRKLAIWSLALSLACAGAFVLALRKPRRMVVEGVSRLSKRISDEVRSRVISNTAAPGDMASYFLSGVARSGDSLKAPLRNDRATVIGRDRRFSDFVIGRTQVSRRHCRVSWSQGSWWIEDLNSAKGVSINGLSLQPFQPRRLQVGDFILIAGERFALEALS